MTLIELSIALSVCDGKLSKLGRKTSAVGEIPEEDKDVKYWTDKREGIKELMEQTVRAINIPKKEANGES